MRSECCNCGRQFTEKEEIIAMTIGTISEDEFAINIDEPWQEMMCIPCQNAKKPKQDLVKIKITVEGGVIQAISGIPTEGTVEIYDFDTDGIDINALTRIKSRPDDPEDNEYEMAIVTKWMGPPQT